MNKLRSNGVLLKSVDKGVHLISDSAAPNPGHICRQVMGSRECDKVKFPEIPMLLFVLFPALYV